MRRKDGLAPGVYTDCGHRVRNQAKPYTISKNRQPLFNDV